MTRQIMALIQRAGLSSTVLTIAIVAFSALKFVNLEADFPPGVTESGVLYTDEGWYSNAAVTHTISGRWYREGDFNPIVNMPIGQLIQAAVFSVFGAGLTPARATAIVSSLALVGLTLLLARRYVSTSTALLVAFLLTVNLRLFAYSRLAILDVMMLAFTLASACIVTSFGRTNDVAVVAMASLVLAIAALTKSTAVFAIPSLMYLAGSRSEHIRGRIGLALACALVVGAAIATYNLVAWRLYAEDILFFRHLNFEARALTTAPEIVLSAARAVREARCIEPIIYPASLLMATVLFIGSGSFRKNRLVRLALVWLMSYVALLGTTGYHPDRYFLPLLIPASILFAVGVATVIEDWDGKWQTVAQLLVVAYVVGSSGLAIAGYMRNPMFSFARMARDVAGMVTAGHEKARGGVLLGNLADSVMLASGIPAINSVLGTRDLEWKIRKYQPGYYIVLREEPDVVAALQRHYRLDQVAAWDVFGNYYGGSRVRLFRLTGKAL